MIEIKKDQSCEHACIDSEWCQFLKVIIIYKLMPIYLLNQFFTPFIEFIT